MKKTLNFEVVIEFDKEKFHEIKCCEAITGAIKKKHGLK